MVTYEITAIVESSLAERYERYMIDHHIGDLLATGHFTAASIAKNDGRYRIRYEARTAADLEEYLQHHAGRLREDFARHFPNGVEVSRETWDVLATFPPV